MKHNKRTLLQVRLSDGERDSLDFLIEATGKNASELVRSLILLATELATFELQKQALAGGETRPVQLRIVPEDSIDRFLRFLSLVYKQLEDAGREDLGKEMVNTILGSWFGSDHKVTEAEPLMTMREMFLEVWKKDKNHEQK